ncbi:hypothetical protein BgiMline_000237 [Biomphalaria glabrata]|uniref:Uncharacterized protein LOC106060431 n=1 Tax=Biomphalaria glabrata TaxID=6526 RepID=A0A9W2ZGY7_BIOGL|nr:uncharacterized protein LOC106060431 [Biomphalaria glabrata]KAI8768199.1 kyphoscoliosis peptidase-like [Biomphalaria glabrata]
MTGRPEVPSCFLGSKPNFVELKLERDSHQESEFTVDGQNNIVITFKAGVPIKVVTQLIQVATETDLVDYVLTQRKNKGSVSFYLGFPANGWYKFLVFALDETDPGDSCPNVFNYLINVQNIKKPARPYPRVYTKFYTDCAFLYQPLVLHSESKNLDKVHFELTVPGAYKVALHVVDEWFLMTKMGEDKWDGVFNLSKFKKPGTKVQVMAAFDPEGTIYSALLDYIM